MSVDLPDIFAMRKRLAVVPTWGAKDSDRLVLLAALDDEDGVTVQGLYLRITAMVTAPEECITVQLEYRLGRKEGGPLCRIDWMPFHSHENKGCGPPQLQFMVQTGSNYHTFHDNWLERPDYVRRGELPIAVPMDNPPSDYRSLLDFVSNELNIQGLEGLGLPPWRQQML